MSSAGEDVGNPRHPGNAPGENPDDELSTASVWSTAEARVRLLHQATLQIWIALGATLIVLGFGLARFEAAVMTFLSVEGHPAPRTAWWPAVLGTLVVLAGSGLILLAGARYVRREREIERGHLVHHDGLIYVTLGGMTVLSLAVALALLLLRS